MEPIKKFAATTSLTRVPFAVKYNEATGGGANKNKMEKFNERSTPAPYMSLGKMSENTVALGLNTSRSN